MNDLIARPGLNALTDCSKQQWNCFNNNKIHGVLWFGVCKGCDRNTNRTGDGSKAWLEQRGQVQQAGLSEKPVKLVGGEC